MLIPAMGEMGFFGANLEGYGCAGMSNVEYGLIMQELERGDSGVRSFVSVQGALVMYPIYTYGSEEQKKHWLPKMVSGEVITAIVSVGALISIFGPKLAIHLILNRMAASRESYRWPAPSFTPSEGQDCDVVIFATPDRVSQAYAADLVTRGVRFIDYSGDFRFTSTEDYARYAERHPSIKESTHGAADLLDESCGSPGFAARRIHEQSMIRPFAVSRFLTARRLDQLADGRFQRHILVRHQRPLHRR